MAFGNGKGARRRSNMKPQTTSNPTAVARKGGHRAARESLVGDARLNLRVFVDPRKPPKGMLLNGTEGEPDLRSVGDGDPPGRLP